MHARHSDGVLETRLASTVGQPCRLSSDCGPFTASSNGCDVRAGRSRYFTNSWSLLPPTSVKLSICHVMTVVNRSRGAGAAARQSSSVIGCHVFRHSNAPVGTGDAGVPMFEPKVKSRSKRWKNSTYQGS